MAYKKNSGIYKITNLVNNKIYIGSAICLNRRIDDHKYKLSVNKHHNLHLQASWNKYGKENFRFEIIAKCPPEYLLKLEQWFIDNLKPKYNKCPIAGNHLGLKWSEKAKEEVRNKKRRVTEEQKDKIRNSLKSNGNLSFIGVKIASKLNQIPVYRYSLDNILLGKWNSLKEASISVTGTKKGAVYISLCCKNKKKEYKNSKWSFKELK